jgi:HK97 gp10 family phage protein
MAHISGLDRWERWIDDIPQEVQEEVKELVETTGFKVKADAQRLVPVDTGHLRRSIKAKVTNGGYTTTIGTNVDYSIFVEFGTSKKDARPFLIPAYVKHKEKFERELRRITEGIGV